MVLSAIAKAPGYVRREQPLSAAVADDSNLRHCTRIRRLQEGSLAWQAEPEGGIHSRTLRRALKFGRKTEHTLTDSQCGKTVFEPDSPVNALPFGTESDQRSEGAVYKPELAEATKPEGGPS